MMRKKCRVVIDDQMFTASRGDVLLDAALLNGVDIPRDCRSGHCGTCRVRVLEGSTIGGECGEPGAVHACQSRIISDLRLELEPLPEVKTIAGHVSAIIKRAPDVMEVGIEPAQPVMYLPGQYLRVQFRGYPERCYIPTVSMNNFAERQFIHLQVRRVRNGRVSGALGGAISEGHRVKLLGPLGTAFLRPGSLSRLVLVASGTGFAPIWSIAAAAIQEHPGRRMVIVVGAGTIESLYMIKALCILARFPNVTIIPVVEAPQNVTPIVRIGSVIEYVPELSAEDIVHTCGSPAFVENVSRIAAAAGAPCYDVSFVPHEFKENTLSRAFDWFRGVKRKEPVEEKLVSRRAPLMVPSQSSFQQRVALADRAMQHSVSGFPINWNHGR